MRGGVLQNDGTPHGRCKPTAKPPQAHRKPFAHPFHMLTSPMALNNSSSSPFELRAAQAEDALCLSVLAMQVYLDTYATQGIRAAIARDVQAQFSTAVFEQLLRREDTWLQVAEQRGHLIGFAQNTWGATHTLATARRPAELARLYVQEPFTAKGVGTALLHRAEHAAHSRGCDVLWLTPWVHNLRALAFYARRGYADHGVTVHLIEGEAHGNCVFAKPLVATDASASAPDPSAGPKGPPAHATT